MASEGVREFVGFDVRGHLLEFAFDTGLGFKLTQDGAAQDEAEVEFGFAGAVATDGVEVGAWANPVVFNDCILSFIGGYCGDDIRVVNGVEGAGARDEGKGELGLAQIVDELVGGKGVDVVEAKGVDAQAVEERECLELGLCSVTDDGHGFGVIAGEEACGEDAGGGGSNSGEEAHF